MRMPLPLVTIDQNILKILYGLTELGRNVPDIILNLHPHDIFSGEPFATCLFGT